MDVLIWIGSVVARLWLLSECCRSESSGHSDDERRELHFVISGSSGFEFCFDVDKCPNLGK